MAFACAWQFHFRFNVNNSSKTCTRTGICARQLATLLLYQSQQATNMFVPQPLLLEVSLAAPVIHSEKPAARAQVFHALRNGTTDVRPFQLLLLLAVVEFLLLPSVRSTMQHRPNLQWCSTCLVGCSTTFVPVRCWTKLRPSWRDPQAWSHSHESCSCARTGCCRL